MNAIFYKPLQKVVGERLKFVEDTYEEAKVHKEKSEAILKDRDNKLENTRHDAKKIIFDKSEEVKTRKDSLTKEARQKASTDVENAKSELQNSSNEAQNVLSHESQMLADVISAKILGG